MDSLRLSKSFAKGSSSGSLGIMISFGWIRIPIMSILKNTLIALFFLFKGMFQFIVNRPGIVGAEVKVALEIEATVPSGVPENVVRTVMENSKTLKFRTHGFEKD